QPLHSPLFPYTTLFRSLLGFADERSVVSSRFITSSIVLLRAHLAAAPGARPQTRAEVRALPAAAALEVDRPLPPELTDRTEFTLDRKSTRLNSSHLGIS